MRIWEDKTTGKLVYVDDFIDRYNETHHEPYDERTMSGKLNEFITAECFADNIGYIGECY